MNGRDRDPHVRSTKHGETSVRGPRRPAANTEVFGAGTVSVAGPLLSGEARHGVCLIHLEGCHLLDDRGWLAQ